MLVENIREVTREVMEDFIDHEMQKGDRIAAINTRLRGLRVFFRFCEEHEHMGDIGLKLLKEDETIAGERGVGLPDYGSGVAHHLRTGTLGGAIGREGQHSDFRVNAEESGGSRGLYGDLRHLLGGAQYDITLLVKFIFAGDVYGAISHDERFVAADEDETGGNEVSQQPQNCPFSRIRS